MLHKRLFLSCLLLALLVVTAAPTLAQDDEFVFGLVLVGPENDHGWSQAHYEAGQFVEEHVPSTRMIFFPSLNPADNPQTTLLDVVTEMVDQGAKLTLWVESLLAGRSFQLTGSGVSLLELYWIAEGIETP